MRKIVMLVHGLGGGIDDTWGNFPKFLRDDIEIGYEVFEYQYQSPKWWKILVRAPSIPNIASGLLTDIRQVCNLEVDELILVGHSLGGIVIKYLLLDLKISNENHNIKKICFFDVPHEGSGYANVGKHISFRNRHLKSLCRDSSELDLLNDQWVKSGLIDYFDILSVISANDDIVSSSSSKSIYRNHPIETVNNVNHKSIVKPKTVNDTSFLVLKKFVLRKITVLTLKNAGSRDFIDWLRVDRAHRMEFITDLARENDLNSIVSALDDVGNTVRITGASGLGKTRTLIESIKLSNFDENEILTFDAALYEREAREAIRKAVENNIFGLIIVEKCSVELHNDFVRETKKNDCQVKVVTLDYFHEHINESPHIKLTPLGDDVIKSLLKTILVNSTDYEVDRIANFFQGYPLMVTLLAELNSRGLTFTGHIDDATIIRKLIWGNEPINQEENNILKACSLFDVFGVDGEEPRKHAKFIAEFVAGTDINKFDKLINRFAKRQIINCAGRFARVVPKPLAVTLAAEWWGDSNYDRQVALLMEMPSSLIESFSVQLTYLDAQPNVQRFSEKLCVHTGPFGKAEVLFTEKGSKFFRALVELNPEATCNTLHRNLCKLSSNEILAMDSGVRRNLVWALEKLCCHSSIFEKVAYCLLLLAANENETYSNNSTGIFAQLFRVHLSGTSATPEQRFRLLNQVIQENDRSKDLVVIKALEQSLNFRGGSRTVGAEYQGTKPPIQEWSPKVWQEIFEYWDNSVELLFMLFDREGGQRDEVLKVIGYSLRELFLHGRTQLLDTTIRKIIDKNGRYWPQGLDALKIIGKYDVEKADPEAQSALQTWLEMLEPRSAEIVEQLKILVVNPPWEHEEDSTGQYEDIAAKKAAQLASTLAKKFKIILPHIELLIVGDQRQSYVFGRQLAIELEKSDCAILLESTLAVFKKTDNGNLMFVSGILEGIYVRSRDEWESCINTLREDEILVKYYPDFIRTGKITQRHLATMLELVKSKVVDTFRVSFLANGGVLKEVDSADLIDFCIHLSEIDARCAWVSVDILFMYSFSNKECLVKNRDAAIQIITNAPLSKDAINRKNESYHWKELVSALLREPDKAFAEKVVSQLIFDSKIGFDHGDLWHAIKPTLNQIMKDYGNDVWPLFSSAIEHARGLDIYWLQQLLDRENTPSGLVPSVLNLIDPNRIIEWCKTTDVKGAVFIARCIDILSKVDGQMRPTNLFVRLLENFGDDVEVKGELNANMITRGWAGSLVPYLESDKAAFALLVDHKNPNVRLWVNEQIGRINQQIEQETLRDREKDLGIY